MSAPRDPFFEIQREHQQLLACRWGFWLLGASIGIQFALLVLPGDAPRQEDEATPGISAPAIAATAAFLAMTLVPAAALFWRNARSPRWRRAAAGLALATLVDLACQAAVWLAFDPASPVASATSLVLRSAALASMTVTWLQLWAMTVLVHEFAVAGKADTVASGTEYLGFLLLAGMAFQLGFVVWVIPDPYALISIDDVGQVLAALAQLCLLIAFVWMLNLLLSSAGLASLLLARCVEIEEENRGESGRDERPAD